MKTLTVVFVSSNNPKFAILAPVVVKKVGNREIISRGEGGWLESNENWTKGEVLPDVNFNIVTRTTKDKVTGQDIAFKAIELV